MSTDTEVVGFLRETRDRADALLTRLTPAPPTPPAPEPPATPTPPPADGIWVSPAQIAALPTSGKAWEQVKGVADGPLGRADLADQDSDHDVNVYACALVYARTRQRSYGDKARDGIAAAIGTEKGGRTLALGRNLPGYVIAADLVDLKTLHPETGQRFRVWLDHVRRAPLDGRTLVSTHEDRPNNWGTHAGAARIAAAVYLGDRADLDRAALVLRGWLGDRDAYTGFRFSEPMDWHADPSAPVGINPKGATRDGHPIDGVLPDDQRRGGGFKWPPPPENYVYEALQGVVVAAELLRRAGYEHVWEWEDRAVLRAYRWLHDECGFPAEGDDTWQPWLVNRAYGTDFPAGLGRGKNVAFTGWTHGG